MRRESGNFLATSDDFVYPRLRRKAESLLGTDFESFEPGKKVAGSLGPGLMPSSSESVNPALDGGGLPISTFRLDAFPFKIQGIFLLP